MRLTGPNFRQLHHALLDAFDRDELAVLVRTALDHDLDDIAGDGRFGRVVHSLITWAERTDRVGDLVQTAAADKPGNAALRAVAAEFPTWQPATRLSAHDAVVRQPAAWVPVLALGVAALALTVLLVRGGSFGGFGNAAASRPDEQLAAATVPTATPTATFAPTATPTVTPTPAPPTPTPLPFPTARPSEYLVVVSEFVSPPSGGPGIDVYDAIVAELEDACNTAEGASCIIGENPQPVQTDLQAEELLAASGARQLVWGRVANNRLRVNLSHASLQDLVEIRFIGTPALPSDTFFAVNTPERLRDYLAPFVLGLHFLDAQLYPAASAQFARSRAVAAQSQLGTIDGLEYLYLFDGIARLLNKDVQATASFSESLTINPRLVAARYNLALAHWSSGDSAAALEAVDLLLQSKPEHAYAHALRGAVLATQAFMEQNSGRQVALRQEAIAEMSEALALLPPKEAQTAYDIYNNRATMFLRLGDTMAAEADSERVLGPNHDCTPVLVQANSSSNSSNLKIACAQAAINLALAYSEAEPADLTGSIELLTLAATNAQGSPLEAFSYATLAHIQARTGDQAAGRAGAGRGLVACARLNMR